MTKLYIVMENRMDPYHATNDHYPIGIFKSREAAKNFRLSLAPERRITHTSIKEIETDLKEASNGQ